MGGFGIDRYITSNCKTQLMKRDPISPCGASHVLYFVLVTRYCKVPLYSLFRHLSIVLSLCGAFLSEY